MRSTCLAFALALSSGCAGDKDSSAPVGDGGGDGGTIVDDTATTDLGCGTAGTALPDGLVELSYDDGEGAFTIEDTSWSFDGTVLLGETEIWEAVRFELAHPARVVGFSVSWAQLPEGEEDLEIPAGIYPDFGYNGFDFWQYQSLWEGTRCKGEIDGEEETLYVTGTPIEFEEPGLVYVAHHRTGTGDAAWWMDESYLGDGACGSWDDCHSALNAPQQDADTYFNGLSTLLPYDYRVRLYVEYTDDVQPEDTFFQPLEGLTPSSRQSWGDYDRDGDDDLLTTGPTLYRNDGGGSFTDVTTESGISGHSGSGGTWGDYDNDGCLDLFLFVESYTIADVLLHSTCDGAFEDVTALSGLDDTQSYDSCDGTADHESTPAAAWLDLDNDGLLDLYLSNFICWTDYTYFKDRVWHNLGDGLFEDWSTSQGFDDGRFAGRGAAPIDADQDGDIDILINNYVLQKNLYFENQGDGTVDELGTKNGLSGERTFAGVNYYGHTIGTAWGDLDNDGDFDVIEANLAHPRFYDFSSKTEVLMQTSTGAWENSQGDWSYPAGAAGLRYQETYSVPVLGDFDQDGALDLAISAVYDGRPTDFYWGQGDGSFELDAYHAGITIENGWGMAASDIDGDGDLDLAGSGVLFENTLSEAEKGSWLQVGVIGDAFSNRSGIGATVRIETSSGDSLVRYVNGGTGQGCQDSLITHFGLGEASSVDLIEVDFPGGGTVQYDGPFSADQRIWVMESGDSATGMAPPI